MFPELAVLIDKSIFGSNRGSSVRQFEREDPIGARVWSLDAVIALGDHDDQEDP